MSIYLVIVLLVGVIWSDYNYAKINRKDNMLNVPSP